MQFLSQLKTGQYAVISAIEAEESIFHRLSALGFRVGKPLCIIRRANFNGPLHVRLAPLILFYVWSMPRAFMLTQLKHRSLKVSACEQTNFCNV